MKRQFFPIRRDRVAVRRKLPIWVLLIGLFGFAAIPLVIYFDTLLAPVDTGFNILWVFLYGVLCSGGILGAIFYWLKCRRPDCINHLKLWRNLSKFYPIQSIVYILFFFGLAATLGTIPLFINQILANDVPKILEATVTEKKTEKVWTRSGKTRHRELHHIVLFQTPRGNQYRFTSFAMYRKVNLQDKVRIIIRTGFLGIDFYQEIYLYSAAPSDSMTLLYPDF